MGSRLSTIAMVLALALYQPQSPQRFTSSIDVVQVDVSAVDADGRPIRDLTVADFELRVDGRVRPIVTAQFVTVPPDVERPAAPKPAHFTSNAGAGGGRLIMIVVDRTSIATGRGRAAIDAASRFVGRLSRVDRVALASIPNGPQINFTADHALVQRLLRQIDGTAVASAGARNIGIADALAFERRDPLAMQTVLERECGVPNVGAAGRGGGQSDSMICTGEVRQEAGVVAADARERARNSIRGLQALIEGLAPSQTPKILVYISEGLVIDRESAQLSWLDAKAAAAHVTIYPLHLQASEYDASQRRPPVQYAADRALQEQGLATVAQATRGDVFRVMSNSDFAFERLSNELSGYYLLGFEPEPGDRNGRNHAIGVRVRRTGVTVRSRRQFTIGPERARTAESEMVSALRDPLPAAEIPVAVTTYTVRHPQHDKLRLVIAAEIDRSINPEGQISVGYVVVGFDGKLAGSRLDASPVRNAASSGRTARYYSSVLVDPGRYTLKLVVVDDARRRGSVERIAEARLTEVGPIRATDILLAEHADPTADLPVSPTVSGEIDRSTLHGHLELFADSSAPLDQAAVTWEVAATETSAALERVPATLRTSKENARCRIASADVNIERLPPGDYVARAVITTGSGVVGRVSRPFKISRAGSSPQS